jgi:hypothetical protein
VHIDAPTVVLLHRRPAGSSDWVVACSSPCDKDLPTGDSYRITGRGVTNEELVLDAGSSKRVDIEVHPRSVPGMVGGAVIMGIGGALASVGFGLLALTSMCESSSCDDSSARKTGFPLLAVGTAVGLGGLLLFVNSLKSDFVQSRSGKQVSASYPLAVVF